MEAATADKNVSEVSCIACGEFPVNHFLTRTGKTFDAWVHDRAHHAGRWNQFNRVSEALRTKAIIYGPHLVRALHAVSGGKTLSDPSRVATERAHAIWQEAIQRDMKMEQLVLFGAPIDSYRVRLRDRWVYFESLPIPPRLEARTFPWADDKFLFKQFLNRHHIPAARAAIAANLASARESLKNLRVPVVVKPRLGSNSRHTTPLVHTDAQFIEAFALAQQLCRYVLFEEHLYGYLCRATVVDGKLVGFLESRQPIITGNGIQTVAVLIKKKNTEKPVRVSDVVMTEENLAHIRRQGYEIDSIPEKGKVVQLSRIPGRGSGGENREMLTRVHPKLREYVEKTAQLLEIPVVGFDLIIPDADRDPDTQTWGILEANTVPFIEIHSDPLYGEPSNVAAAVWDLWN